MDVVNSSNQNSTEDRSGLGAENRRGLRERFVSYVHWLYLQYLLGTALYMLEPWEQAVFNSVVVVIFCMSVYTTYVFLPQYTRNLLVYAGISDNLL